jgi:hypothetical protein
LQDVFEDRRTVNAVFSAKSLAADVVLLYLYPNRKVHEASAKVVGKVLTSFEDFIVERLQKGLTGVSAPHQEMFDVNLISTFQGSFGIEIAVRGKDSRIGSVLKSAVSDLELIEEPDTLMDRFRDIRTADPGPMQKFIHALEKADSDLKVETASQNDVEPVGAVASVAKMRTAIRTLKTLDVRVAEIAKPTLRTEEVEMIGLNLRTKVFELRVIKTDERLKGKMIAELFSDLKKAEIPRTYRVVLEAQPDVVPQSWKMISATKL